MTLNAILAPDAKSLGEMGYNLVEWYCPVSDYPQGETPKDISSDSRRCIFSKETFVNSLLKEGFYVISRLRNDAVLFYPTLPEPTGKRGHPKWYDGKVDFAALDLSRCEEVEVDKCRRQRFGNTTLYIIIQKSIIHNAYMLNRFICVSGLKPNTQVINKLFKELVLFTARTA